MSDETFSVTSPGYYAILVQGTLDPDWGARLSSMQILNEPTGAARLTGYVADQAALQGVLEQLYAFGLPILSVTRLVEGYNVRTDRRTSSAVDVANGGADAKL